MWFIAWWHFLCANLSLFKGGLRKIGARNVVWFCFLLLPHLAVSILKNRSANRFSNSSKNFSFFIKLIFKFLCISSKSANVPALLNVLVVHQTRLDMSLPLLPPPFPRKSTSPASCGYRPSILHFPLPNSPPHYPLSPLSTKHST